MMPAVFPLSSPARVSRRRVLAGLAAGSWLARAAPVEKDEPLGSVLEALRQRADLPALAAMAFRGERVVDEAVTGLRRRGTAAAAATLNDRFHIGSITKSMTAVLAARWVEAGRLQWSTTLGEVLGADHPLEARVRPLTLWQLLRHRSGLRRDLPDGLYEKLGLHRLAPGEQRRALARVVLAEPPEHEAETACHYSNAGYIFAGLMLETLAGRPWEELVKSELFEPLGLASAGFGAPAAGPGQSDQPWGHRHDGEPVEPGPEADNVPALGPAGTVHLSLPDLARYARWHLRENDPQPALVTAAALARLHGAGQTDGYYGGWDRLARGWAGGQALTHTGTNTTFFAVIWLAPARDFGVLAVSNQGGERATQACDAACAHLISCHL